MSKFVIFVRGQKSEWSVTVPEESVKDMRADGFEVHELVNTVPVWAVDGGIARVWCAAQDIWNAPTRLWRAWRKMP